MRIILFLIFFTVNGYLFSREMDVSLQHDKDTLSAGLVSLNCSPLSLLDIYNGSAYRFGIQFRPLKRIATGADGGGYIESITKGISGFFGISGYHYRFRMAYFPEKIQNWSFGVEYQFKKQQFSYSDSTETESTFQADVTKKVFGTAVFIAYDYNFSERFFLNIQLGVGIRYRDIFNTRSDVVGETSYAFPWDSMNTGRVKSGQNFLPNLTLGIRIGYVLIRN